MATSKSKIAGKTVRLVSGGKPVTKDQVQNAFEQIYRLNGCLGCGLLGIDVIVHGSDRPYAPPPAAMLGEAAAHALLTTNPIRLLDGQKGGAR